MLMVNTTLSNTWGAPPANGIDIEPDHPTFRLQNISFEDVRCVGNSGQGFEVSPATLNASSAPLSISVRGLYVSGAGALPEPANPELPAQGNLSYRLGGGIAFTSHLYPAEIGLQGSVEIAEAVVEDTAEAGVLMLSWSTGVRVSISDSVLHNVVRSDFADSPLFCASI